MIDCLIFSVDGKDEEENENNQLFTLSILRINNIEPKIGKGRYKGRTELVFIVSNKHRDLVFELTNLYDQESVLEIDSMSTAALHYLKDKVSKVVGTFVGVTSLSGDSDYTFVDDDGLYEIR
jgi:hypothetical protein